MNNTKLNLNLKKNKKIFKSASLTFYSNELGYLFCEEFRYKEKKILIHPIGGKVEDCDKDIFSTAIREFIEEVNLESHPIINSSNNIKKILVEEFEKKLEKNSFYIDLCINKENKYFHRYFIVPVDDIQESGFKKNIIELTEYFNGKYKTEINNLVWYKIHDEKCNNQLGFENEYKNKYNNKINLSWLTKMFLKFF